MTKYNCGCIIVEEAFKKGCRKHSLMFFKLLDDVVSTGEVDSK